MPTAAKFESSRTTDVRIAVVGAGIGGLAAAAFLERSGHEIHVFEAARQLGEVGAGIQISPNGSRLIERLGRGDALAAIGTTPSRVVIRRWQDDRQLSQTPLGSKALERWGAPYYNVYRPDMIEVLRGACATTEFHLGRRVAGIDGESTRPTLVFEDHTRFSADLVVGADGIHSRIRHALFGEQPTRFSGWVAYRALVPRSEVLDLEVEVTNRLGPDAHIVSYFVGRHQRFLNLVCISHDPDWSIESWNEPGDKGALLARFTSWSPTVRSILGSVDPAVFRWALHDRQPLPKWSRGAVTLLGDSAHPMVPFMAQGACQAIEDAAVLDRAINETADVKNALALYESARRPRTANIQGRSFANATIFHFADGPEQKDRDATYAKVSALGDGALANFDWLYDFDAMREPWPTIDG